MVKNMMFAALLAAATVANAHVCIHGNPEMQHAHAAASVAHTTYYHTFEAQEVAGRESIRVGIDYSNLVSSKYCTQESEVRPFISSGGIVDRVCTAQSVFNPSVMRTIITDQLMPRAKTIIESTYNVTRIASQTISPNQCGDAVDVSGVSSPLTGVDLQIFVAAGVFPAGMESTIAYAYPCTLEGGSSGRPISAVINFNPNYLAWDDASTYSNEELVQTAVHELHHAMGFTLSNLNLYAQTRTIRDKTVKEIRTPNVLAKAKEFYGCEDITGVEVEDEGASGSQGSHWDRRVLFEDLMVAAGGAKLSTITLAFMEDLSFYNVNYSKATPMVVGKGAGCGFVDEKCNTEAGGKDTAWFFDSNYRCSPDHRMMTRSTWGDTEVTLPAYYQYDTTRPTYGARENAFTDRCPYGQRVSQYECAWEVIGNGDGEAIGSYPGIGSRCFETSGLRVDSSSSTTSFNSRCIQAQCPFGGTRIEFKLGSSWVACPIDGSVGSANSPAGYSGTIYCPNPATLCDDEISIGSSEREEMASGDASLAESTAFSTITITASFNGTQWESVLSDENRVAIINHLRQDMAYYLKTSSGNLRARRVIPTSTGVSAIFGVAEASYTDGIVSAALNNIVYTGGFLVYTRQTYGDSSSAAASEAPFIALTGFTVDQPQSESICSKSMSPEKCVTIIAVVVFAVVCIILLILIYCICLRNPFAEKPRPVSSLKYGAGANGGGGKDKL